MKLVCNSKILLKDVKILKSPIQLGLGLMFASKKRAKRGVCLTLPKRDVRYNASVTMFFCFYSYDILFVNSKMRVVDKVTLPPWKFHYTPKKNCSYIIESLKGTFKDVQIKDKVVIM